MRRAARALVALAAAILAAGCTGDEPDPKALKIVSDLALHGASASETRRINQAIELYLDQIGHRAGPYRIELEAVDDSTAARGAWDAERCAENARRHAADESIVGVVGTFHSGCTRIALPILNEASLALVSPANGAVGLTHEGAGLETGEPGKYYPTGVRTYVRVIAADDYEAKVAADFMAGELGVETIFILNDGEAYGRTVGNAFEVFAVGAGMNPVGHEAWDPRDREYRALVRRIARIEPDSVFLAGYADLNGARMIADKVDVLGDNDDVELVLSDGFLVPWLARAVGDGRLDGAYAATPAIAPGDLGGAARPFLAEFERRYGEPGLYTAYGAAAAQALVDAIGRSDGTRADVVRKLFETDIPNGIVGPMAFDDNGDPRRGRVGVYESVDGAWVFRWAGEIGR